MRTLEQITARRDELHKELQELELEEITLLGRYQDFTWACHICGITHTTVVDHVQHWEQWEKQFYKEHRERVGNACRGHIVVPEVKDFEARRHTRHKEVS